MISWFKKYFFSVYFFETFSLSQITNLNHEFSVLFKSNIKISFRITNGYSRSTILYCFPYAANFFLFCSVVSTVVSGRTIKCETNKFNYWEQNTETVNSLIINQTELWTMMKNDISTFWVWVLKLKVSHFRVNIWMKLFSSISKLVPMSLNN